MYSKKHNFKRCENCGRIICEVIKLPPEAEIKIKCGRCGSMNMINHSKPEPAQVSVNKK